MGIRKGERKIDVKENNLIEEIEQNQECTRRDTKGNENGRMKRKKNAKKEQTLYMIIQYAKKTKTETRKPRKQRQSDKRHRES